MKRSKNLKSPVNIFKSVGTPPNRYSEIIRPTVTFLKERLNGRGGDRLGDVRSGDNVLLDLI